MSKTKQTRSLTEGPIGTSLLMFALPILAGNIAQSLNGSVNAIWVGKFLGEAALTATANANNIMFFLIGSVFGIGMAATILIGQSIGAKDLPQARRVMGTSATFFISLSAVIAVLGWFLSHRLLLAMGTPAESLPMADAYLKVIFLAMPLLYAFAFITAALRGAGDARTPFRFLLLAVLLDIAFNPLLIFGVGPFPELGIAGAAWATFFSQGLALAGLMLYLRNKRHMLWLGRKDIGLLKIDTVILKALVIKGVPMGLQMILISLAMIMMISMVNGYGVETASANGSAMQLWTYVQMPAMAIGAACSSMAAQNVGAGLWKRVDATARAGVLCNVLMTGTLIALAVAADRQVLSLFLPDGSAALETARHLNHIAIGSFLFFGVTFVISGVVRSTGAVVAPLVILALALWGVRVPFAQWLQPVLGVDAIWWSFPVSAACAMLLSLGYYRWGGWRQARMLAPAEGQLATPAEVGGLPPSPVCSQPDERLAAAR